MAKTWFVTGSSRGLGGELVRAVVRAGHQVIAGARDPKAVTDQLRGNNDQVLPVESKLASMRDELDRWRQLSLSTDGNFDNGTSIGSMMAQIGSTDLERPSDARAPK